MESNHSSTSGHVAQEIFFKGCKYPVPSFKYELYEESDVQKPFHPIAVI